MVNVERVLRVADAIEKHEIPWLGFNMAWITYPIDHLPPEDRQADLSGHQCGTVACIAGWTNALALAATHRLNRSRLCNMGSSDARKWLELSPSEDRALFVPDYWMDNSITPADAVRTLRRLAATGKVDWSKDGDSAPAP